MKDPEPNPQPQFFVRPKPGKRSFASSAKTIASRLVARGHFEFRDLA